MVILAARAPHIGVAVGVGGGVGEPLGLPDAEDVVLGEIVVLGEGAAVPVPLLINTSRRMR